MPAGCSVVRDKEVEVRECHSCKSIEMRLLENVSDTLVSSYFPSQDEINQRFSATDISSENPYWDSKPKVVSLSDICIKVIPSQTKCAEVLSWKTTS